MPISINEYTYPFDHTGTALTNKVANESHVITQVNYKDYYFVVPKFAPFFGTSLVIYYTDANGVVVPLVEGVDYFLGHHFLAASRAIGKQIYGSISLINKGLKGIMVVSYQTLGGMWTYDEDYLNQLMTNIVSNPRISTWDSIVTMPATFPVIDHEWDLIDAVGMNNLVVALLSIEDAIRNPNGGTSGGGTQLLQHINDNANPHRTTKTQVGLGDVENYAPADIDSAKAGTSNILYMTPRMTKEAILELAVKLLVAHEEAVNNPHSVTKQQIGLGSVDNFATASVEIAKAGLSTDTFVTPAGVLALVNDKGAGDLPDHISNEDNPHKVTAAQVNAYTIEQINQLLSGKLGTNATAADSSKFDGKTYQQLLEAIVLLTVANSSKLEGKTLQEVIDSVQVSSVETAQNSIRFNTLTLDQLYETIPSSANVGRQVIYPVGPQGILGTEIWTHLASTNISNKSDVQFLLTGGDTAISGGSNLYHVRGTTKETDGSKFNLIVTKMFEGSPVPQEFAYKIKIDSRQVEILDGDGVGTGVFETVIFGEQIQIWHKSVKERLTLCLTELSPNNCVFPVTDDVDNADGIAVPSNVYETEPVDLVYVSVNGFVSDNTVLFNGKSYAEVMTLIQQAAEQSVSSGTSSDANMLGGELPTHYALASELQTANDKITALETKVDTLTTQVDTLTEQLTLVFTSLGL